MTENASTELYATLLERQKERLHDAFRRKGELPTNKKEPGELIQSHSSAAEGISEKKPPGDTFAVDSSIIAPYYPPSKTPPSRLVKIPLGSLRLETHHRGSYLILATHMCPIEIAGVVISIMRDEHHDLVMTSHHYENAESLYLGGVFIIREPYFTITAAGDYCVRVDHVTDMMPVCPTFYIVPLNLRRRGDASPRTVSDWKHEGDRNMQEKSYLAASMAYTSALACNATYAEKETITMNRALANLNIHSYDEALNDLRWLMVQDHPPEKAIYRNAQALYHLGHFQLCRATLTKLLRDYPKNENALREKARVEQRLAERKSGIYDFRKMYCASRAKSLDLDHSSYFGPVMVKVSRGRGFGLFTTDHVKAGDLLLCEKAFSYSHKENAVRSKDSSGTPVLANMLTNRIMIGTQVSLMKETIQKLKLNPSLLSTVTSLHHGTYVPSKETDDEVDDEVIDTFLIYHILSLNTFGCPISSRASHANGRVVPPEEIERQHSSSGLWTVASRINHSCLYNARRSFIGDMQIVRAACDMPSGTEITFIYQTVDFDRSEFSRSSNVGATHYSLQNWGFECTCAICNYGKTTTTQTRQHRAALLNKLEWTFRDFKGPDLIKAEELLAALEKTYSVPAAEVPRLAIWQPYLFLTRQYVEQNKPKKIIQTALKLLKALGFMIQGHWILPNGKSTTMQFTEAQSDGWTVISSKAEFEVMRWGLMIDHVIEVFLHIFKACQTFQPELCNPVEAVARTAYKICVGEDESFWDTYGTFYGCVKRPWEKSS